MTYSRDGTSCPLQSLEFGKRLAFGLIPHLPILLDRL